MELTENIARGARSVAPYVSEVALVLAFLLGLVIVCYGIWLIYEPAAYIAAGGATSSLVALYIRGS